jgi:hypothetical protein
MQVDASDGPEPHGSAIERDGARLFVGAGAVELLEGRTLDDAVTEKTGRVRFVLRQPSDRPQAHTSPIRRSHQSGD